MVLINQYLKKYPLVCCLPFDPKPMPDMVNRWALTRRLVDDIPYKPFVPKACSKTFVSLENEWHWMRKVMNKDRDETEVPYFFQLPFFISKKGVETDELRKKYCKARDRLAKKFYGRKFSEVIAEEAFRK